MCVGGRCPEYDGALKVFEALREADPFRIEGMELLSNILFVKEAKVSRPPPPRLLAATAAPMCWLLLPQPPCAGCCFWLRICQPALLSLGFRSCRAAATAAVAALLRCGLHDALPPVGAHGGMAAPPPPTHPPHLQSQTTRLPTRIVPRIARVMCTWALGWSAGGLELPRPPHVSAG
jgi:hypothetical protein